MVHALEKIRRLLRSPDPASGEPGGILIDIHPTSEPSAIEVRIGGRTIPAGWLQESDDYAEYEDANDALATVVKSGLFAVEREGAFDLVTHAGTAAELREYVAEEWEDARIDDITAMRAEELLSTAERDKEVILRESARIARLRPLLPRR